MSKYRGHRCFVGIVVCLFGFALAASGCSKGGYSGPTGTVTGKVTLDGEPVPSGSVVSFLSDSGFTASGKVGAGGSYTLLNVDKPAVPVAKYKVAVSPPAAEATEADYDKYMSASAGGGAKAAQEVIPAKFASHASSGLSFDVKEGPNTINIELKK